MLSSELLTYKSKVVTNDTTNGGRMSSDQVVSGVVQNVWPHVTKAERAAGSTLYRKLFDKAANDDDETLINPIYFLDGDTQGEDWIVFAPGTQTDTVADMSISRWYGSGELKTAVSAGVDTILTVVMKDASIANTIGLAQDTIVLNSKLTPDAASGYLDLVEVTNASPSVSDNEVTFTLTAAVAHSFDAGTKVCAAFVASEDLECSITKDTDANSLFDETEVVLDNIGTTRQTITFTFTSETAFTVAADDMTGLSSGSTASEYVVTNTDFSKPVITVPTSAWVGTPSSGNTVVITISPAAQPLWQKRVVPSSCASLANNYIRKVTMGESLT
jgi:hypothetical protein